MCFVNFYCLYHRVKQCTGSLHHNDIAKVYHGQTNDFQTGDLVEHYLLALSVLGHQKKGILNHHLPIGDSCTNKEIGYWIISFRQCVP